MSKKFMFAFTILMIGSLLLAACGQVEDKVKEVVDEVIEDVKEVVEDVVEKPVEPALICQITDTGGIDDKSFNQTAWKGIEDAIAKHGVVGKYLESQEVSDYEKNLNAFIEDGCDLIITVGFMIADATEEASANYPDRKFSIVDYAYEPPLDNVVGQLFQTDEAGFLAGYAAAAVSQTGKVGTFGGLPIPTVTIFMKGFVEGVDYYNAQKGTDVVVLGYDLEDETKGLFSMSFDDQQKGRELAISLMDEGADVIMPVAGPVGIGAAAAIQERGNAYLIGVDADWFLTNPEFGAITLTSVMKLMDATTLQVIESVLDNSFTGGNIIGTLENGGVDLAPFHDLDSVVSAETKAELDQIKADIISGALKLK